MIKSALVVVAEGFEDIEAVAPVDLMTRAGIAVTVAGIRPGSVKAAYGTTIVPDCDVNQLQDSAFDAVVFPGAVQNAESLAGDPQIVALVRQYNSSGKLVAAICASPSHLLGEAAGILKGKRATGHPEFHDRLAATGAIVTDDDVTVDGNIITGRGPGAALHFALRIVEYLAGRETADIYAVRWRMARQSD